MKLLLDQNISVKVDKNLKDTFPGINHIQSLNLLKSSDRQIWDYAKKENYSIITFDADFYDLCIWQGHPPKIIWLRLHNQTTSDIAAVLTRNASLVKNFIIDSEYSNQGVLEFHD